MKTIYCILLFGILACNLDTNTPLVFSIADHQIGISRDEDSVFYLEHNVIIYNDSLIYYHGVPEEFKKNINLCGTGLDFTKPPYFYLQKKDVIPIHSNQLHSFLSRIARKTRNNQPRICISSNNNLITGKIAEELNAFVLCDSTQLIFRITTEEQNYVCKAKINNKYYDPSKIQWKIGFSNHYLPWNSKIMVQGALQFID